MWHGLNAVTFFARDIASIVNMSSMPMQYSDCKVHTPSHKHGTAQHSTAWLGSARHGTAWHGMAQHNRAQHGTVQRSKERSQLITALYSAAQTRRAQLCTALLCTARHSTARHGTERSQLITAL